MQTHATTKENICSALYAATHVYLIFGGPEPHGIVLLEKPTVVYNPRNYRCMRRYWMVLYISKFYCMTSFDIKQKYIIGD